MVKSGFLTIFIICMTGCSSSPNQSNSLEQAKAEEAKVYSVILHNFSFPNQSGPASECVISEDTVGTGSNQNPMPGYSSEDLNFAFNNLPDAALSTEADFRIQNNAIYPVGKDRNFGTRYTLLTKDEWIQIFQNQHGWETFYNQYPNAFGLYSLSRVGFNSSNTQALIFVGMNQKIQSGAGQMVLLNKVNGVWVVKKVVELWISLH